MESVEAWHFLGDDRKLQFHPFTSVEAGQTLEAEGILRLCSNGMHASRRAIDALQYAPGAVVCRVRLDGETIEANDKLCARSRTVLWMADATTTLRDFAVWCAEQALLAERERGREPDPRSWACIEAVRAWMRGDISDADLLAARSAAELAAWSAAESAAESAARSAARSAAWSAAESAARSAARSAAELAAWSAAWSAARSAAWSAAWSAQNEELERRLNALAPQTVTA